MRLWLQTGLRARPGWLVPAAWAGVLAVPFAFNFTFILNYFYIRGASLLDAGFGAAHVWRNDWLLSVPRSIGDYSYYATHASPLFHLTSAISSALPIPMVPFFAVFQAVNYTLPAAGLFYVFVRGFGARAWWAVAGAALLAVVLPFSGVSGKAIAYPHHEFLIPALALWFLALHAEGRDRWAILPFVLALTVREDAGFHITAVLGLYAAWRWWCGTSLRAQRVTLAFLVSAFAYSVAIMAVQRIWFPGDDAFQRVFTGTPPYAHLSVELLRERAVALWDERAYLVAPAVVTFVWAAATRSIYPALGYLAYLPWFVLSVLAIDACTATFCWYHGFPFALAMAWPVLGAMLRHGGRVPPGARAGVVALQVLVILAGFTNAPGFRETYLPMERPGISFEATERFIERVEAYETALGGAPAVHDSVAALAPDAFLPEQRVSAPRPRAPAMLYFHGRRDYPRAARQVQAAKLDHFYRIRNTLVRVATREPLPPEAMRGLDPPLEPLRGNLAHLLPTFGHEWEPDGTLVVPRDRPPGVVLDGPEFPLRPGRIELRFLVRAEEVAEPQQPVVTLDVLARPDGRTAAHARFTAGDLRSGAAALAFRVPPGDRRRYEFRVHHTGNATLHIDALDVTCEGEGYRAASLTACLPWARPRPAQGAVAVGTDAAGRAGE